MKYDADGLRLLRVLPLPRRAVGRAAWFAGVVLPVGGVAPAVALGASIAGGSVLRSTGSVLVAAVGMFSAGLLARAWVPPTTAEREPEGRLSARSLLRDALAILMLAACTPMNPYAWVCATIVAAAAWRFSGAIGERDLFDRPRLRRTRAVPALRRYYIRPGVRAASLVRPAAWTAATVLGTAATLAGVVVVLQRVNPSIVGVGADAGVLPVLVLCGGVNMIASILCLDFLPPMRVIRLLPVGPRAIVRGVTCHALIAGAIAFAVTVPVVLSLPSAITPHVLTAPLLTCGATLLMAGTSARFGGGCLSSPVPIFLACVGVACPWQPANLFLAGASAAALGIGLLHGAAVRREPLDRKAASLVALE